jgi:hypothetical protein
MTPHDTRSPSDSELAPLVADFYEQAPPAVRTRLLQAMLRPVGTLALVALAAGAFARLLPSRPSQPVEVTPDVVSSIRPEQVSELVRYVEQKAPELLDSLPQLVGSQQAWMATASGALLLATLAALRKRRP